MYGRIYEWMDGWIETDGWMDVMDGWMNGWMDGWMDHTYFNTVI